MKGTSNLTPAVQTHLTHVYAALCATVLMAAFGAFADIITHMGGLLTTLCTLGMLVLLGSSRDQPVSNRIGYLLAFGFFKGMSIGQLIEQVIRIDPSIIVTAFLATCCVFLCFSGAAVFAKRRSYLYLAGVLGSAVSMLCLFSFINFFFPSYMGFQIQLYGGLLVFCLYILVDTQMMIEKFNAGDRDFVWHSVELFIDFVAIFVRILIILAQNSQKKEDDRRRRR
eukprot:JP436398.1.p1 GENE.JP436398.1~~JP436398.1.p1  ORF type:complete len:258 (+),score=49.68 JP436398.1:102-776(+)